MPVFMCMEGDNE